MADITTEKKQNILFATSEVRPFVKAGGLGSVARDLPIEYANQGHNAMVVLPWYDHIEKSLKQHKKDTGEDLEIEEIGYIDVPFDGKKIKSKVGKCVRKGVTYLFVEPAHFDDLSLEQIKPKAYSSTVQNGQSGAPEKTDNLSDEEHIQHIKDMQQKKAYVKSLVHFNKAIPKAAALDNFMPDVIHANDWQTSLLPLVLQHSKKEDLPEGYANKPTLLSLHRAEFVGDYVPKWQETRDWLELEDSPNLRILESEQKKLYKNHADEGMANPLGIGCELAEKINTVSPNYAKELMDGDFWTQYERYKNKLVGIVNRIDTTVWNPETNPNINNFSADNLEARKPNKETLIKEYGFADSEKPLLVYGGRISPEKGLDLLSDSLGGLVEQGYNVLIGGPVNDEYLGEKLAAQVDKFPGKVTFAQGNQDLRKFFAGADFSIVPSKSEPCGVVQMESQAMGAIPIGRAVGGIPNTIEDGNNGYLFNEYTPKDLLEATERAKETYDNKDKFTKQRSNCLNTDNSWAPSAKEYLEIYKDISPKRRSNKRLSVYSMWPRNYSQLKDGRNAFTAMKGDIDRVAKMGEKYIHVNPFYQTGGAPKKDQGYIGSVYATRDTRLSNPSLFGEAAKFIVDGKLTKQGQEVHDFCDAASKKGIDTLFDLAQSHLSPDSPFIQEALNRKPSVDIIKRHKNGKAVIHNLDDNHNPLVTDPKHIWDDAVVLNYDDPAAKDFIIDKIWIPYVEQMAQLGFKGIRIDSTLQTPTEVHKRVTDAFKKKRQELDGPSYKEPVILGETLIDSAGYEAHEIKNIATHCYSSAYFYPNNNDTEKNADTLINLEDIKSVENWLKAEMWRKQRGLNGGIVAPVSTHDEPRLAANIKALFAGSLEGKSDAEIQKKVARLARIKIAFGAFASSGGSMMLAGDEFLMTERANVFDGRVVNETGHKLSINSENTLSAEQTKKIKAKAETEGINKPIDYKAKDGKIYSFMLRGDTYKQSIVDWNTETPPKTEPVLIQVALQKQIPELAKAAGHSPDANLSGFIKNVNNTLDKIPETDAIIYSDMYFGGKNNDIMCIVNRVSEKGIHAVTVTDISGRKRHMPLNDEVIKDFAEQSGLPEDDFLEKTHIVGNFPERLRTR